MPRTILHSDLNAFYATVECIERPELKTVPMAVCGDPGARHGIILTKNQLAKAFGVATAEPIWQARRKCPGLVLVRARMDQYIRFSRFMRDIYAEYTDRIEPFGMDEAWLDVSGDDGEQVAAEIRRRAREELGLTASVGVADNKIFAKLGSDMRKPDATTIITRDNFRQKVWPLPAAELLYVGPATRTKLARCGIYTIGDIARCDPVVLTSMLGKHGDQLYTFANGRDRTPVSCLGDEPPAKSIGNSTTMARDVCNEDEAKWVLMMLSEMVGERLREHGFRGSEVQVWLRDTELFSVERQTRLARPTDLDHEILDAAMALLRAHYGWMKPLRSLGVRVGRLICAETPEQVTFFDDPRREKRRALEKAIDGVNRRFGEACVRRGYLFQDMRGDGGHPLAVRPDREYRPFDCGRQGS